MSTLATKIQQARTAQLPSQAAIDEELARWKYSEDQPRDDEGQWTDTGGGGDGGEGESSSGDPTSRLRPLTMQQHRELNASAEQWTKGLSAAQKAAVSHYTSDDGYAAINHDLRTGAAIHADKIAQIDAALGKATVPTTVTVYRGVSNVKFDNIAVGGGFKDFAYSSTTARLSKAKQFAGKKGTLLAITVPAGSRGGYLDYLSGFDENELLLPRGSVFRIDRKERRSGRQVLHVTVVQP